MKSCHACGEEWTDKRSPGFREECMTCGAPLHCCKNCRFFDGQSYEWCGEPQARAEKPRDTEQGNTCDYFVFGDKGGDDAQARAEKAKRDLASLFGEDTDNNDDKNDTPDWMKPG